MQITKIYKEMYSSLYHCTMLIKLRDQFTDILFVDPRQGLCADTKEHNTVGD